MNLSALKAAIREAQSERTAQKMQAIRDGLTAMGHSELLIRHQLGLIESGYRGVDLHDDTCAIITSAEYLEL